MQVIPFRRSRAWPARFVTSDNLVSFLEWALDRARQAIQGSHQVTQRFSLHDLTVTLVTANREYARIAGERLYAGQTDGEGQAVSVALLSPDDSDMPPTPAWGEAIYHPREIERMLEGTPYRATYFHDEQLWQIYDHRERFGVQWMRGSDRYPPWEAGAPLRVFLHWAYRFLGKRLVHAGTLGRDGRGILLAGKGGSGKSGTVLGGIVHGLDSVGDDYVLVEMGATEATAYPLFRTLKQDVTGVRRLGLDTSLTAASQLNWQNKHELRIEQLGRTLAERLQVRALVIPRITHGPVSSWAPLSRSRAMLALAPSGLMQMPGERESGVAFFSQLVRSTPCYELRLGRDPAEVNGAISAFLETGCDPRKCDWN